MTVTVISTSSTQFPLLGVKVYVVVCVLSGAGDQVPVIPLLDVLGKSMTPPSQMSGSCVKTGVLGAPNAMQDPPGSTVLNVQSNSTTSSRRLTLNSMVMSIGVGHGL